MSADHAAVLVASIASGAVAVVLGVAVVVLARRVRELSSVVAELRHEAVPLVRDARVMADQAATELTRVGDVLESAEAVSTTVDSASRLAYRIFANPVVKLLAYGTGTGSALRRLVARSPRRAPRPDPAPLHGHGHRSGNGTAYRQAPAPHDTSRRVRRRRALASR